MFPLIHKFHSFYGRKMKLFNWFVRFCFLVVLFLIIISVQMTKRKSEKLHSRRSTIEHKIPEQIHDNNEFFNHRSDSIVFFHIQKTSGTVWIDEIKSNLNALYDSMANEWKNVCTFVIRRKYYDCRITQIQFKRPVEVFWHSNERFRCDVHAGFAELENCIKADFRRFGKIHFLTNLRNPQERYMSEFAHVKRGATWNKEVRKCLEQDIYSKTCYKNNKDWSYVNFTEFLECEHNLANNRQVRMLANYNKIGCSKLKCWLKSSNCSFKIKQKYENELLESAKQTLSSFSFFGLAEHQKLSLQLFEKTFEKRLKFSKPFPEQIEISIGKKLLDGEYKNYSDKINEKNRLDIILYEFAKTLFFQRVYEKNLTLH